MATITIRLMGVIIMRNVFGRIYWPMSLARVGGCLFAAIAGISTVEAQSFGADSRAYTLIGGFQYAGGYTNDFQEFINTGNGAASSAISGTFAGNVRVDCGDGTAIGSRPCDVAVASPYSASANLATGQLKAYAENYAIPTGGYCCTTSQSGSNASLIDTLTFAFDPSLNEQYLKIGFRTTVQGVFTPLYPGGTATMKSMLTATSSQTNFTYGGSTVDYFGIDNPVGGGLTYYGRGTYGFDMMVRAGSPFDVTVRNGLSVRAYGAAIDYSHTSTLGIILPDGVSYTSASGVLLSQAAVVPEPATWALMIGGFGMVAGAIRRRERRVVAA